MHFTHHLFAEPAERQQKITFSQAKRQNFVFVQAEQGNADAEAGKMLLLVAATKK